jgi:CRP-like cAMP-binding protein
VRSETERGGGTALEHGVAVDRRRGADLIQQLATRRRAATVVADTDMVLLVLSRAEFRSPHFLVAPVMERMLTELGRRLRCA